MWGMEGYHDFKEFTSTVDIKDMRAFLSGYLNDINYMGEGFTDEFVAGEYLAAMKEMEKDMGNTTDLKPDLKVEMDDGSNGDGSPFNTTLRYNITDGASYHTGTLTDRT